MANTSPTLDLIILDTHDVSTIAVGDTSSYPNGFSIATPTLQVSAPNYPTKTFAFVAHSIQVYNAYTLGIYSNGDSCSITELPDGIYTFKYSVDPVNVNNVTKQFLRTAKIEATLDEAFLKLELMECDGRIKKQKKETIDLIEYYIRGAIASANKCALKQATELYGKASKMLNNFISNNECNC